MAFKVREQIISYVMGKWEEFHMMSHDCTGNNYENAEAYTAYMSCPFTYGGYCELFAAAELNEIFFEDYMNGELYANIGRNTHTLHRLKFSTLSNNSEGHFDVYKPADSDFAIISPSNSSQIICSVNRIKVCKKRSRFTNATRKIQLKKAKKNTSGELFENLENKIPIRFTIHKLNMMMIIL